MEETKVQPDIDVKDETPVEAPVEMVQKPIPLTYKEVRALKKANYASIAENFDTIFVIQNVKTGQIVELRAASSFHAANMIGWKPNKVKVLKKSNVADKVEKKPETTSRDSGLKIMADPAKSPGLS